MKFIHLILTYSALILASCAGKSATTAETDSTAVGTTGANVSFSADSAYTYLARQVEFGPRVPNSEAHTKTADWLVSELSRHGAKVIEQKADLKAFDGTTLHARNIFGRINPDATSRILLLAHYDCRPWADQDPDETKRNSPVDGANDGASGVAVILEAARQLKETDSKLGVDFLFVDAEDWGTDGDDDSWAMGAHYFAENPPIAGYAPDMAVLLDMVGGKDAVFPREFYSQQNAPAVNDAFWRAAKIAGFADRFPDTMGGVIT
ncbi:MAG: M28 family peptidase, partial [Muribaculaceae bacterium]|nr:M28 family peptidase [Muribaculaceae bacterium]